ncbi:MAG: Fe-S-containing protein [Desulfosporosinus sp.]|nr:Fe-S-containing protein [Desulfosporosinus sp.]
MLGILDYTLKSSFEAGLLVVTLLLYLYLTLPDLKSKVNYIWIGTGLALVFATVLVYGVDFWGNRELFEFAWLSSIFPVLALLILTSRLASKSKPARLAVGPLVLLTTVLLVTVEGIELVGFPIKIFVQARSFINTELILKVIGALFGIFLAALFGWTYFKSTRKMNKQLVIITGTSLVTIVLARHLISLLQLGMSLGYIPVTPVLVSVVAPVINTYYPLFFFALVLLVAVQVILARAGSKKPVQQEYENPALRRKSLAEYRNQLRWLTVTLVLILTTGALLGVGHVYSNKKVKLSPPVPVQAENGVIVIPVTQVNDNKLHRFNFVTQNNVTMRFIVVAKGNGLFGVGLDACDICGVVGYYQRGDNVVCLNCDVIINKQTIGFPGAVILFPSLTRWKTAVFL